MSLVQIYECLCDQARLRILNALSGGPLCVCHLQEILGERQVKISKHLGYLKRHGIVGPHAGEIYAWYDNEWGYVNRMAELTYKVAASL